MQERSSYPVENQPVKYSRLKWLGTIVGGAALPLAVLYPVVGDKAVEACQSGYTAPHAADDNVFDNWGRNLAVRFCGAEVPQPALTPPASGDPHILNV